MYLTPKLFQLPTVNQNRQEINNTHLNTSQQLPSLNNSLQSNSNSNSNQNTNSYYLSKQYNFKNLPVLQNNNGFVLSNTVNKKPQQLPPINKSNANVGNSEVFNKPRIITIIRATDRPRKRITILLNRKALHSFEQFICDISDAFGLPQWKNDKIRKLYNLKGKRIQAISDFFRDDDIFIGVSGKEPLKKHLVIDLLQEIYPDNDEHAQALFREWESSRSKSRTRPRHSSLDQHINNSLSTQKENAYNTDGETSTDKKINYIIEFDENGRRKRKKKVLETDVVMEMEMQRQKERLKLIEIERKKREQTNKDKENINRENKNSSINNKRVNIVSPLAEQNDQLTPRNELNNLKKPKRKIKFKPKPIEENSLEITGHNTNSNNNNYNLNSNRRTPSNMSQTVEESNTNRKSKSPGLPKDIKRELPEIRKDHIQHDINEHKQNNQISNKLKRQISNFSRVTDRYEILKTLGDGNFAVVKQARLKNTDHEYAIKIIDKSKMKGKESMIENEIYIMKSCNHPNIVKLHEEFETKNEVYLITDLVKGGDLFDAISQSVKFNEKDSACMVQDICEALFYLHSKNIVHRDLKPENLLVMRKKDDRISIKLADFGLAMVVNEPIFTVCGTPTYVAPEILSEIGYGLEVDMWACGVITYILLCGFPPFRSIDRNQEELFRNIQSGDFEYLMPYWEGISDSSKDLINNLLVVDKKKRWKPVDVLCHPWIVTQGNSKPLPTNFDEYKKELLKELADKAKAYAMEPFASK